jgi:Protein kinase domain
VVSESVPSDTGAFRVGFAAGLHIAGYRLDGEIGRGSIALLYRARDERLGRLVALKVLAPELADDETFRQWFIQELRAVTSVRHPHIMPVFEAGEADGMLYLAMRYVPGGDARSLTRREGPMPPWRVAAIVWQAASALDAMHAAGLLHRDVKPTNILIEVSPGRRDWVYLSDFALFRGEVPTDGPARARLSANTLACISPELIEGKPADGRADEYSLAASAFEFLTGWPPFPPDDAAALLQAHLTEPPPRLTSRRPDLPPSADDVLAKALAKAPEHRYASCREFAAALAGALGLRPPPPGVVRAAGPVSGPPAERVYLAMPDGAPGPEEPVLEAPRPAAPALVAGGSVPDTANAPGPPEPAAGSRPGGAPGGRSGEPWLVDRPRGRRRPLAAIALAVVAVLAAASVAVVATGVLRRPAPPKPLPRLPGFPIAARSALPPVSGDVWVTYQGAAAADAQVYGDIKDAARGDVARLYAQPFPYTARPGPVASVVLHPKGKKAPYVFQVTPAVATRYHVSVFQSRTGRRSLASSPTATIYVAPSLSFGTAQTCSRPTCHETFTLNVLVAAQAIGTEISKPWYTYFGLNLSKSAAKPPAAPTVLQLGAGGPHVSVPRRVSGDEFVVTVTFSFPVGKKDGYAWLWAACTQGSVAVDGVGLPGPHGCGGKTIPVLHSYLG